MKYKNIMAEMANTVWAIMPERLEMLCGLLETNNSNLSIDAGSLEMIAGRNRQERSGAVRGTVGILPILGVLSQRTTLLDEFFGGVSTDQIGREFDRLVKDSSVRSIVLDIDSPGGSYAGTPELAERIYSARGSKPITAQVNSMTGSAAFWIASAADEIVVTPSGDIGSHGVLAVHYDLSGQNEQLGGLNRMKRIESTNRLPHLRKTNDFSHRDQT